MSWTDERVETLKKLWQEGHSASQIAKTLGGTVDEMIVTPRQGFLPAAPQAPLDPDAEGLDETGDFVVDDADFLDHTF